MGRLRCVLGKNWGLNPDKIAWVYSAIIRPKVTYGALVWAHALTETTRQSMRKLQRKAQMAMDRPLRSTPTTAMEVIVGLEPLDLFTEKEAAHARLRTRWLRDTWDGIGEKAKKSQIMGHRRHWDDFLMDVCPQICLALICRQKQGTGMSTSQ